MTRLLLTTSAIALFAVNAFATPETAAIAEAANAQGAADATIVQPVPMVPGGAVVAVPAAATVVVPAGTTVVTGINPLGPALASHIKDPETSKFREALARTDITAPSNPDKGYTVFAVVNDEFDPEDEPVTFYIVNDMVSVGTMAGASDRYDTLSGDSIRINRTGNRSYYVDDMRVNDRYGAQGMVVYTIGGSMPANF